MQGSRLKRSVHIVIDALMGLDLLALMATYGREDVAHEYFGVALFVLFIVHQGLNWKWWATRFQGRYRGWRVVDTVLDLLLLVCMLGLIASSLILSQHAFSWLPALPGEAWAKSAHMLCSSWFFLLAFIHMGLHVRFPKSLRTKAGIAVLAVISAGILVGAIFAARALGLPDYLFLQTHVAFVDYSVPIWMPFLQNALIAVSAIFTGSWFSTLLRRPHPRTSNWGQRPFSDEGDPTRR